MHTEKYTRGFTLIELLVVISVITLLSSVVYVNATGARERAQDTKKVTEAEQVEKALVLYKEREGSYPAVAGVHSESGAQGDYDGVMNELVDGGYLGAVPDSSDDSYQYIRIELDGGDDIAFFGGSSSSDDFRPNPNNCAVDVNEGAVFVPCFGPGICAGYHNYAWWLNDDADTYIFLTYAESWNGIGIYAKSYTDDSGDRIGELWGGGVLDEPGCGYIRYLNGTPVDSDTVVCPNVLEEHTPNILEVHEMYQEGVCTSPGEYCSCSL